MCRIPCIQITASTSDSRSQHLSFDVNRILMARSDPIHRHLSVKDVRAWVAPEAERNVARTLEWLRSCAANNDSELAWQLAATGDYLRVELPVECIEKLLQVEMHHFTRDHGKRSLVRASAMYSLPLNVIEFVRMIDGVVDFPPRTVRYAYGIVAARLNHECQTHDMESALARPVQLNDYQVSWRLDRSHCHQAALQHLAGTSESLRAHIDGSD